MQGEWGRERLGSSLKNKYKVNGKSVFDDADLYNYGNAPAINLRDSHAGTLHQRITARQNTRTDGRSERTYKQERDFAEEDLRIAGVSEDMIQQVLKENDDYYRRIYNNVKQKLKDNQSGLGLSEQDIDDELFAIFCMAL